MVNWLRNFGPLMARRKRSAIVSLNKDADGSIYWLTAMAVDARTIPHRMFGLVEGSHAELSVYNG